MIKRLSNLNKKGITITTLTIYVIVATVIVGVLAFLNANFFSNIDDLTEKANIVSECMDFKSAFLRDIKSENDIKVTDYNNNMIRLSNNVKYEIRAMENSGTEKKFAIYRNDAQIAKQIISHTTVDGETVKEGPYFEYNVDNNTITMAIKFSNGNNTYIEKGTYVVGGMNLAESSNNSMVYIPGDINMTPSVPPVEENVPIPEGEEAYAVLYRDGTLEIGNTKIELDATKVVAKNYDDLSFSLSNSNTEWTAIKDKVEIINIYNNANSDRVVVSTLKSLFEGCTKLISINGLENLDMTSVTNAENMFKDCANLRSVDFSKLDNNLVIEDTSGMFKNCTSLETLKLNTFTTNKIADMSEMFSGCTSIENIDFNVWNNTTYLKNVSRMFENCILAQNINISGLNTSNVTDFSRMFYNCRNLTTIGLANLDASKALDMSYMFANCEKINSFDFTSDIMTTSNVLNMEGLFLNCGDLTEIDLSGLETNSVTNMARMFEGCERLVTFKNMSYLDTSKVTNMSAMFKNCESLNSVYLEFTGFKTSRVTNMSEMFMGCSKANQFSIANLDTTYVTDFASMFEGCSNVVSLNLQNFNTLAAIDMSKMFMDAKVLTNITVSDKWITDYTNTNIKDMHTNCGTTVLNRA